MDTAFSHALRVVVCQSCGGAVHGVAAGGEARCSVCDATTELPARDEAPLGAGLSRLDEDERLTRLAAQDPTPPSLPPAVEPLARDGVLIAARAAEAFDEWQLSRVALKGGAAAAEERFFTITLLLAPHMAQQGDDLMLRAVLETALDLLPSPSAKQVVRALAAREAARLDDLPAAEEWFAPCDEASPDLRADSAYRVTAAYLATHKRQFERVLDVLGETGGAVPMSDDLVALGAVLRANALERTDRLDAAVGELAATMEAFPDGAARIEHIVRSQGDLNACRRSYVPARSRIDGTGGAVGSRGGASPKGTTGSAPVLPRPLKKALPWLLVSVVFLGLYGGTAPTVTTSSGQRIDVFFLVLALSFALPGAFLLWRGFRRHEPPRGKGGSTGSAGA